MKKKLQKMQKVLGDDVMNFATSSTDDDELDAKCIPDFKTPPSPMISRSVQA